jgi:hypothetical protein
MRAATSDYQAEKVMARPEFDTFLETLTSTGEHPFPSPFVSGAVLRCQIKSPPAYQGC